MSPPAIAVYKPLCAKVGHASTARAPVNLWKTIYLYTHAYLIIFARNHAI